MKLGFVSAILPEFTLDQVLSFAQQAGFSSVELMCWPPGGSERRYAGVTHLDATNLSLDAIEKIQSLQAIHQVAISGLGYYPNPLSADQAEAEVFVSHLRKVIDAAAALGVGVVNTFVGRDPSLSVDANWPRFLEVWRPLIAHAEGKGVKIGIENCPMFFTRDEWPGGKNLATTPSIWRRMFQDIPSPNFGLNFDPSHLIWQQWITSHLWRNSRTGSSTSTPRTPGSTGQRSISTGSCLIPICGTPPRSPAWATSAGVLSSVP